MDIISLNNLNTSKLLSNNKLFLESALDYWGLSSIIARVPIFLSKLSSKRSTSFETVLDNNYDNDFITDNETGLQYTTPERTICDMILHNRRDDLIIEALDDYLTDPRFKGKDYLLEISRKYKVEEQLEKYISEINDYFTEV